MNYWNENEKGSRKTTWYNYLIGLVCLMVLCGCTGGGENYRSTEGQSLPETPTQRNVSQTTDTPPTLTPRTTITPLAQKTQMVTCPECKGTGYTSYIGSSLIPDSPCQVCGGRGWRAINGIVNDCPACKGTGKNGRVCSLCSGKGFVSREDAVGFVNYNKYLAIQAQKYQKNPQSIPYRKGDDPGSMPDIPITPLRNP